MTFIKTTALGLILSLGLFIAQPYAAAHYSDSDGQQDARPALPGRILLTNEDFSQIVTSMNKMQNSEKKAKALFKRLAKRITGLSFDTEVLAQVIALNKIGRTYPSAETYLPEILDILGIEINPDAVDWYRALSTTDSNRPSPVLASNLSSQNPSVEASRRMNLISQSDLDDLHFETDEKTPAVKATTLERFFAERSIACSANIQSLFQQGNDLERVLNTVGISIEGRPTSGITRHSQASTNPVASVPASPAQRVRPVASVPASPAQRVRPVASVPASPASQVRPVASVPASPASQVRPAASVPAAQTPTAPAALVPPPPPPPPAPGFLAAPPPPPAPGFMAMPAVNARRPINPTNGGRADLLAEITRGTTLRPVPREEQRANPVRDGRPKAAQTHGNQGASSQPTRPADFTEALRAALNKRRIPIAKPIESEGSGSDWEDASSNTARPGVAPLAKAPAATLANSATTNVTRPKIAPNSAPTAGRKKVATPPAVEESDDSDNEGSMNPGFQAAFAARQAERAREAAKAQAEREAAFRQSFKLKPSKKSEDPNNRGSK